MGEKNRIKIVSSVSLNQMAYYNELPLHGTVVVSLNSFIVTSVLGFSGINPLPLLPSCPQILLHLSVACNL